MIRPADWWSVTADCVRRRRYVPCHVSYAARSPPTFETRWRLPMLAVSTIEELHGRLGQELGVSDWHPVTQQDVTLFAEVTHDRQWIHTDVEKATQYGPFGGTIAHGYYTLALAMHLMQQVVSLDGFAMVVNYGLNRVRFPAPLPVGERVRLRLSLEGIEGRAGGGDVTFLMSFECAGQEKPVCIAESVVRVFDAR
jgi:acyl dehydratase